MNAEQIKQGNVVSLEQWRAELNEQRLQAHRAQERRQRDAEAARLQQYLEEAEARYRRAERIEWALSPVRVVKSIWGLLTGRGGGR